MRPVNNYFNYTGTAINKLEVDSLSDKHYWVNPIPYLYTTLYIKKWKPGYFFFLHSVHKKWTFLQIGRQSILWDRWERPLGKLSRIRGNTPRSGDITCMDGIYI